MSCIVSSVTYRGEILSCWYGRGLHLPLLVYLSSSIEAHAPAMGHARSLLLVMLMHARQVVGDLGRFVSCGCRVLSSMLSTSGLKTALGRIGQHGDESRVRKMGPLSIDPGITEWAISWFRNCIYPSVIGFSSGRAIHKSRNWNRLGLKRQLTSRSASHSLAGQLGSYVFLSSSSRTWRTRTKSV